MYESLEYVLCYNEEKRVFNRLKRLVAMAQRLALTDSSNSDMQRAGDGNVETCQLLLTCEPQKQNPITEEGSWKCTLEAPSSFARGRSKTTGEKPVVATQPSCKYLELAQTDRIVAYS